MAESVCGADCFVRECGNRGSLDSCVGGGFWSVFGRGWFVVCSLFRRVALLDGTVQVVVRLIL